MDVTIGSRLGSYEVRGLLGEGGMGRVFRAFDTKLQRDVAIKVLPEAIAGDRDRLARFEREARTLASLNHPHIAQIYGVEDTGLVMELVEGETLAERIRRGPLPLDEVLPIARQIIDALQAAHSAGVIHRDLKPANIKVREDGTVKVLDFGLAKSDPSRQSSTVNITNSPTLTSPAMTERGVIMGTAAYMSPEQARGKAVDQRTDIWAFGCVLYEMLTGRMLFAGETVSDTIAAIIGHDANLDQLPASTPASIHRLLRNCLARDPRARLHHIADARFDLDDRNAIAAEIKPPQRRGFFSYAAVAIAASAIAIAATLLALPMFTAPRAPQPLLQFAVPMPGPNAAANGLLISPDGRYLMTLAAGGSGMLHALDGSSSRPLEAVPLCWSPDSRSLVMIRANGDLLRMDLAGGPPVVFAKVPGYSAGCSWNASGTLLLDEDGKRLSQLPITGGPIVPVDVDDKDGPEALRRRPQFLPDGRRFLYWSMAKGARTVRAGSLDSRQTTMIGESDAPPIYVDGYLLFQRGGTLVAQAIDDHTLALQGQPRAITSEDAPGIIGTQASFDASRTGMIVFTTTNGGVNGELALFGRRGDVLGRIPALNGAELLNPVFSPDGTRVIGTRMDRTTGTSDIWIVELRTGMQTRVTTDARSDSDAVWSADGTEFAYVSRRDDAPGIYRRSITGAREQLLMTSDIAFRIGALGLRTTDWTADGRFVIYDSDGDIMALPADGSGKAIAIAATPAREQGGVVSRDGRWIAFHVLDQKDDFIYVQPFPGPGPRTRVSIAAGRHPKWSADGHELFWASSPPDAPTGVRMIYSVNLAFNGNAVVPDTPKLVLPPYLRMATLIDNRFHFAVAPDGRQFILREVDGVPGPAVKMILNWKGLLNAP